MQYHVLIVDNERDVLNVIKEMLNTLGIKASGVTSGIKAIELIKKQKYDMIIADLIMPDRTGLDILKAVRGIDKSTPVIITAGVDLKSTNINLPELKQSEFIKKPFTFEDLSAKLRKHFKLSEKIIT